MKLQYYETCNSQYHAGHHLPTVQAMVDGNSTPESVKESLLEPDTTGHLEYQYFKHESYYDEYRKAVDEWFATCYIPMHEPWETTLEVPEDDEDEWDCYSYFVIEEIDEHVIASLRLNPNTCPFCGGGSLHSHHVTSDDDDDLHYRMLCPGCKETWIAHYELTGATLHD